MALGEHDRRGIRIIPIIAEPCDWESLPIAKFDTRPTDESKRILPLRLWPHPDVALSRIAQEVRPIVETMYTQKRVSTPVDQNARATHVDAGSSHHRRRRADRAGDSDRASRRTARRNSTSNINSASLLRPAGAEAGIKKVYKGIGVGTYQHALEARVYGFVARYPALMASVSAMVEHITLGNTASPFISLVRSYAVAEEYAINSSRIVPSATTPAYVYEIVLTDPLPPTLIIIDPLIELASVLSSADVPYHSGGTNHAYPVNTQ
jgi:hypothetical protein